MRELLEAHDILSAKAAFGTPEYAAQQGILAEPVWHELSQALPFLQGAYCAVTNPSLEWLENRNDVEEEEDDDDDDDEKYKK